MYLVNNQAKPEEPKRSVLRIDTFRGVDLRNAPANVALYRSPSAPNMTRADAGKVRKRMGYQAAAQYAGAVNGSYVLTRETGRTRLIHAGTNLYQGQTLLYSGMANRRSRGWQIQGKLYIQDGEHFLVYDGSTVQPASQGAYVPTVIISRDPTGGGTAYEPINLLQSKWKESFLGTADAVVYQLSFGDLDETAVQVQVLDSGGNWVSKTEGTDFTVNRTLGQLTFTSPPGVSPVTGRDNIEVTASKNRDGYPQRILDCTVSILYGVSGAADRLFVSGNPQYPNQDWYSQKGDPTYFGDTWYSVLGQDDSAIVGYSIIGDRLAAHKQASEDGRNVYIRSGQLLDGEAAFPVTGALQGPGALGSWTFGYLGNEPLFLTSQGICAVTAEDITGEKYSQNRSFYINDQLLEEEDLADACAFVYQNQYLLSAGKGFTSWTASQRLMRKGRLTPRSSTSAFTGRTFPPGSGGRRMGGLSSARRTGRCARSTLIPIPPAPTATTGRPSAPGGTCPRWTAACFIRTRRSAIWRCGWHRPS